MFFANKTALVQFIIWVSESPSLQSSSLWSPESLSKTQSAMFRDKIKNYFSCSHLARQDQDYHIWPYILVFRDENEITYCYSRILRRDQDFRKSFLVVERKKMKLTLVENSRDREFSLNSDVIACCLGRGVRSDAQLSCTETRFKSALREVKMVLNTQYYLHLWPTMQFHAKK